MLAELEQRAASSGPLVWRDGALTRDLYHWRPGSGQEVDFILEENRQLLPRGGQSGRPRVQGHPAGCDRMSLVGPSEASALLTSGILGASRERTPARRG